MKMYFLLEMVIYPPKKLRMAPEKSTSAVGVSTIFRVQRVQPLGFRSRYGSEFTAKQALESLGVFDGNRVRMNARVASKPNICIYTYLYMATGNPMIYFLISNI